MSRFKLRRWFRRLINLWLTVARSERGDVRRCAEMQQIVWGSCDVTFSIKIINYLCISRSKNQSEEFFFAKLLQSSLNNLHFISRFLSNGFELHESWQKMLRKALRVVFSSLYHFQSTFDGHKWKQFLVYASSNHLPVIWEQSHNVIHKVHHLPENELNNMK